MDTCHLLIGQLVRFLLTCAVPRVTIRRFANVRRATCHHPTVPTIAIATCAMCHPTFRHVTCHVSKSTSQPSYVSCHVSRSTGQTATSSSANQILTRGAILRCRQSLSPRVATSVTRKRHVSSIINRGACHPLQRASRRQILWRRDARPDFSTINRAQNFSFQCTFSSEFSDVNREYSIKSLLFQFCI